MYRRKSAIARISYLVARISPECTAVPAPHPGADGAAPSTGPGPCRRDTRDEIRATIACCVIALAICLATAGVAPAQQQLGPPIAVDDVQSGALLLRGSAEGEFVPAPTLETDVDIAVTGVVVRARVTQRFVNPTDQWLEGLYVFPLPETAAVDHLRMYVGSRVIEGEIREREVAQRLYKEAKASGRKASLLEQERPNVFTSSVANIGPGETVEIAIEYQDTIPFDGAEFVLRFPLVVAPRHVPGIPNGECTLAGRANPTSEVPDADRITPALSAEPVNPVRLMVELDPGMALKSLYSPSHAIATQPVGGFVELVTLADDTVPADRDFVLAWAPATGPMPGATLLAEESGGEIYALLMVLPPDPQIAAYRIPREMLFVVDTSGSMAGPSLEQAKLALLIALDQLQPQDRFNVIQFNSTVDQLFAHSAPADASHVERARDYVGALEATGGTEMEPALAAALADAAASDELRQIVFMTDGAVGNEEALFAYIEAHLGDSRLFTVGIGAAPNAFFMRKAAQFGRGTFTYVGSANEISTRMDALFRKLERPALADVAVDWSGADGEAWPDRAPDLYAGEPLVLAARLRDLPEMVVVNGRIGSTPWRIIVHRPALETAAGGAGIRQLWARRKIEALMDSAVGGADRDEVRRQVIAVGLEHHLVTNYTSLVAIDVTPTAPDDATLLTHDFPVNAPHGSALPSTATPAPLYAVLALAFLCVSFLVRAHSERAWGRP